MQQPTNQPASKACHSQLDLTSDPPVADLPDEGEFFLVPDLTGETLVRTPNG